ncbi:hypothetical protein SNEBB_006063 [Seison nebaliae]|nr:hypothetical protein SNEBB_006063 [Seison nebaliae]
MYKIILILSVIISISKGHVIDKIDIYAQDLFEGDIELTDVTELPEFEELLKNEDVGRTAVYSLFGNLYWSNGIVPYTIDKNTFSTSQVKYVDTAVKQLEDKVNSGLSKRCLTMKPAGNNEGHIEFSGDATGCSSAVGKKLRNGKHKVSLANPGCVHTDIIQHELMHALGFRHEQSRPDRDSFVRIMWNNVKPGKEHNFNKYSTFNTRTFNSSYHYTSIMHYKKNAFSKNGYATIERLNTTGTVGGYLLTTEDIRRIRVLYNCA